MGLQLIELSLTFDRLVLDKIMDICKKDYRSILNERRGPKPDFTYEDLTKTGDSCSTWKVTLRYGEILKVVTATGSKPATRELAAAAVLEELDKQHVNSSEQPKNRTTLTVC